jgi:hypothetical protein
LDGSRRNDDAAYWRCRLWREITNKWRKFPKDFALGLPICGPAAGIACGLRLYVPACSHFLGNCLLQEEQGLRAAKRPFCCAIRPTTASKCWKSKPLAASRSPAAPRIATQKWPRRLRLPSSGRLRPASKWCRATTENDLGSNHAAGFFFFRIT